MKDLRFINFELGYNLTAEKLDIQKDRLRKILNDIRLEEAAEIQKKTPSTSPTKSAGQSTRSPIVRSKTLYRDSAAVGQK